MTKLYIILSLSLSLYIYFCSKLWISSLFNGSQLAKIKSIFPVSPCHKICMWVLIEAVGSQFQILGLIMIFVKI